MKLSFSTRGWPNLSFDEMLEVASDMGFSGVEVYNLTKLDPLTEKGGSFHKYNIAATVRKMRDKGISIPCFDTSLDVSKDKDATATAIALIETAQKLNSEGKTLPQIAKAIGRSKSRVMAYLKTEVK